MTRAEQKNFVRGLSKSVAENIVSQICEGKIPEDWDGHELRCLLAYRHEQSAAMTVTAKNKRGKRWEEFQNTITVNNL